MPPNNIVVQEAFKLITKSIRNNISGGRPFDDPFKIHVSSLYSFCLHRWHIAYNKQTVYSPEENLDLGRALTFQIGRKIQDIVVESVINKYPDNILRRSVCNLCKKEVYNPIGMYCDCGGKFEYMETQIKLKIPNTPFYISGSIDMFMAVDSNGYFPIEIKSVREEDFNANVKYNYAYQLANYIYLLLNTIEELPFKINKGIGGLLYVCKKHSNSPLKIFAISSLENSILKNIINDNNILIKNIQKYYKTAQTVKICKSKNSPIAKKCPFKKECWEG